MQVAFIAADLAFTPSRLLLWWLLGSDPRWSAFDPHSNPQQPTQPRFGPFVSRFNGHFSRCRYEHTAGVILPGLKRVCWIHLYLETPGKTRSQGRAGRIMMVKPGVVGQNWGMIGVLNPRDCSCWDGFVAATLVCSSPRETPAFSS